MRILVMFDLPTTTQKQVRSYTHFRRFLIKSGFLMMQQSIYCKIALNQTMANSIIDSVRKCKPEEGLVQLLMVTEKQFSRIEYIIGESTTDILNDDKRLVIL